MPVMTDATRQRARSRADPALIHTQAHSASGISAPPMLKAKRSVTGMSGTNPPAMIRTMNTMACMSVRRSRSSTRWPTPNSTSRPVTVRSMKPMVMVFPS